MLVKVRQLIRIVLLFCMVDQSELLHWAGVLFVGAKINLKWQHNIESSDFRLCMTGSCIVEKACECFSFLLNILNHQTRDIDVEPDKL